MAEKVGEIYYNVSLDTREMIDGQRKVDRELKNTTASLDGMTSKLTATAAAVAVLSAAYAALKIAKLADEFRLLAARVEVAAGSVESGSAAFAELVAISRNTQSSLAGNIEVFARLNQSIIQMGGSQRDTLVVTELLAKAIKVSGANAVESKAAMLQFGQALGSGKLAGDELRSLLETAPYLMRQLADGIGVPVGALKKLGEEGKLTADVVTNALTQAAAQIDADFKKFPQTIESAMVVAQDAAALAALKFDELSGSSAALTGVVKGVGEVLDELADQLGAANDEAGLLNRNDHVKTWGDRTREVLSYVADAADIVVRSIKVVGYTIGGLAAGAAAMASGNFRGAAEAFAASWTDSTKTVEKSLAGVQMRQAWAMGAGGGRGSVNPTPALSKLNAPAAEPGGKAKAARKGPGATFDEAAYLASLRVAQASEINIINETETEKLRIAKKNLDERKISEAGYAEAVKLISQAAEDDRVKIMAKAQEKIDKDRERSDQEAAAAREKSKREQQAAMEYAANLTKAVNPVDALRQEYEAKLQLVTQYEALMAQAGVDATEQGLLARTQIENQYELQRLALAEQTFASQNEANAFLIDSLNALSSSATGTIMGLINGTMTAQEAMRGLASTVLNEAVGALVQIGVQQIKNALIGDTLAAADKAKKAANGAVYAASVGAQVAGMSALAAQNAFAATAAIPIVGPGLAPAAALAAGAAAAGIGAPALATAPLAGARQYGGPASAGSMYRVNETGAPEMFTGSNGQQYMLPTKSGQVTAADQVGGNVQWNVIVNNAPPGTTATVNNDSRTVEIAIAQIANQIASNEGPVWNAMRGSTNVRTSLG